MIRIAICDDEQLHHKRTAQLLEKALAGRAAEMDCFDDAEALLRAVNSGYEPDVAVLDIKMANMDGIALARHLNALTPECRIIFLTSFLSFAPDVYETRHAYFVLKAQIAERIGPALQKALCALEDEELSLHYKNGAAARITPVRRMMYLERRLHKTRIALSRGEDWTFAAPQKLIETLPGGRFIHCHQSFWVNCAFVAALEKNEFVLTNDERVPISRTFREEAKKAFHDILFDAR